MLKESWIRASSSFYARPATILMEPRAFRPATFSSIRPTTRMRSLIRRLERHRRVSSAGSVISASRTSTTGSSTSKPPSELFQQGRKKGKPARVGFLVFLGYALHHRRLVRFRSRSHVGVGSRFLDELFYFGAVGIVGYRFQQLLPARDSSLGVALSLPLHHPHVKDRLAVLWIVLQHGLKFLQGPVRIPKVVVGSSEVGPDVRILRIRLQRLIVVLDRVVVALSVVIDIADLRQQRGIVRIRL